MKGKIMMLSIVLSLLLGLGACSQKSEPEPKPEPQGVTKPTVETPPDKIAEKQYENNAFKEVTISEKDGNIVVTGKARVFEGVFQYSVVAGEETLIQDRYQTEGAPAWGQFEITFDKGLAEREGATFELFVYSAKDGSKTDVLTIPLK